MPNHDYTPETPEETMRRLQGFSSINDRPGSGHSPVPTPLPPNLGSAVYNNQPTNPKNKGYDATLIFSILSLLCCQILSPLMALIAGLQYLGAQNNKVVYGNQWKPAVSLILSVLGTALLFLMFVWGASSDFFDSENWNCTPTTEGSTSCEYVGE
jgi:hypothetical protein